MKNPKKVVTKSSPKSCPLFSRKSPIDFFFVVDYWKIIFAPTSGDRGYVSFREGNKMKAFILDGYLPPKFNIAPGKMMGKEDYIQLFRGYMGVSKNSGTPKWVVIMENPMKLDDLGVPLFLETPFYVKLLEGM